MSRLATKNDLSYHKLAAQGSLTIIQDSLRRRCDILEARCNKIAEPRQDWEDLLDENGSDPGMESKIRQWKAVELRIFTKLVSLQRQRDCIADALKQLTNFEEERAHFKAVVRPRKVKS